LKNPGIKAGAHFWTAITLAPETWSGLLEDERTQTLCRPFVGFFDLEPHVPDELPATLTRSSTRMPP
jgi:hypothetical protein